MLEGGIHAIREWEKILSNCESYKLLIQYWNEHHESYQALLIEFKACHTNRNLYLVPLSKPKEQEQDRT